jgi:hypothetical protein
VFPKREAVITSYKPAMSTTVSIGEVGELHLPFFLAGLLVKRTK